MTPSLLRRLCSVSCLALAAGFTAQAQTFSGSDNFDDNNLTFGAFGWRFASDQTGNVGVAMTNQNQRLEFTSSNTSGFNYYVTNWVSPSASGNAYTSQNWSATVTALNLTVPTGQGYTLAGLESYTLTDLGSGPQNNTYFGVYLQSSSSGTHVLTEWGVFNNTTEDFDRNSSLLDVGGATTVALTLSWDATSKLMTTAYSTDGLNFTTGATYDLAGAQAGLGAPYANGFGLQLAGVANAGATVSAGQIAFDDMVVTTSAVPEPSTYALLAGAAVLGLAFWRRRCPAHAKA